MNDETPDPEEPLEPEPEKPRFLLPDGCKDLIDALRFQEEEARKSQPQPPQAQAPQPPPPQAPVVVEYSGTFAPPPKCQNPPKGLPANVTLPELISVRDLAALLGLKKIELVGSLMAFNVFVSSIDTQLRFELASALCSHYGVVAHRAA